MIVTVEMVKKMTTLELRQLFNSNRLMYADQPEQAMINLKIINAEVNARLARGLRR